MLTFGIDWDDVISPLNDCAIELANEEYHFEPPLTLEDIDSWDSYECKHSTNIRQYLMVLNC